MGVGQVSYSADDRKIVWFFKKSVHMAAQSEEQGRPIYEGRHYVHIQEPGERDFIEREAHDGDRARWAAKWQAYQAGLEQDAVGTPIVTLFPANPEIVDMFRAFKVTTVEQLAALTEAAMGRMGMGTRQHVEKAKAFLQAAQGMAQAHALQRQIDERDETITELKQRLAALEAAVHEKRGPGRPPKVREEDAV
jgi:hypothetical protein